MSVLNQSDKELAEDTNKKRRYPDFIIGGAPKCGTTSLHFILNQHKNISIPKDEVHFFDADDPISHPDFLMVKQKKLAWWAPSPANADHLDWYAARFSDALPTQLIGEDSTTYLMSEVAPRRIHTVLPDAQMIFMLRHPVDRAYSQYWHLVKTARTTVSFEDALLKFPQILLGSGYFSGLARFIDTFGSDQVKICLFEDFKQNNQSVVNDVIGFLGADPMVIDPEESWFNKTMYPSNRTLQRAANLVGTPLVKRKYQAHMAQSGGTSQRVIEKLHYWWFKHVNARLMTAEKAEPMAPETRAYLEKHLSARNAGLSQLIGRDLPRIWRGMQC
jgi:hypothetical protein